MLITMLVVVVLSTERITKELYCLPLLTEPGALLACNRYKAPAVMDMFQVGFVD